MQDGKKPQNNGQGPVSILEFKRDFAFAAMEKSQSFCAMLQSNSRAYDYEKISELLEDLSDKKLGNDHRVVSSSLIALEALFDCSPFLAVQRAGQVAYDVADEKSWLKKRVSDFWLEKIRFLSGVDYDGGREPSQHKFVECYVDHSVDEDQDVGVMDRVFLDPIYFALESLTQRLHGCLEQDFSDLKDTWFEVVGHLTRDGFDHKMNMYLEHKQKNDPVIGIWVDQILAKEEREHPSYLKLVK